MEVETPSSQHYGPGILEAPEINRIEVSCEVHLFMYSATTFVRMPFSKTVIKR